MAYGRVYIENLKTKVYDLFDELIEANMLGKNNFVEAFKNKYPKDYALLQYEWEFKVHEFKKNRKGSPKTHPIRPEEILSNMYKNYYFKIIKKSIVDSCKEKEIEKMRHIAGARGYRIMRRPYGKYDVKNRATQNIEYPNLDYKSLKKIIEQFKQKEI